MDTNTNRDVFTKMGLGLRVSRALDTLPQTDTESLFAVAGGRVLITLLLGEVTTAVQSSDPVAKITANPTTGSSIDVGSTVDLSSLEVGGFVFCEGDGTALIKSNAGAAPGAASSSGPWVMPIGAIELTTGASKTGAIKWDLWYWPLDDGAYVEAA